MKNKISLILLIFSLHLSAQTLEDYIDIGRKNNSEIKIKTAKFHLSTEQINEVATYKNTNISMGIFALTPETRVGSQLFKLGASQEIPWFGEFDIKKTVAKTQADLKQYDVALSEKNLDFNIKKSYYEIYKQQAITEILKTNKQILKTYERMALAALSNNRASMSDVLRIRVQKNELHSKVFQNINSIQILHKNFNRLLQRGIKNPVFITDSLNVLDILIDKEGIDKHPSLEKISEMAKVYNAKEQFISLDKKPKIAIGIDYVFVDKRDALTISQNGKDILMPKISLKIPFFNKKFDSQYKQIQIQKEMLKEEIEQQKNNLEMALSQATLELNNTILMVVAAQKNKTEIQRAINVDLKAYETGLLDYDKILNLQIQKIKYQLQEIEATKNAFIAQSKIAYLTN